MATDEELHRPTRDETRAHARPPLLDATAEVVAKKSDGAVLDLRQSPVRQRRTEPGRVSEEVFGQVLSWRLAATPNTTDPQNRK